MHIRRASLSIASMLALLLFSGCNYSSKTTSTRTEKVTSNEDAVMLEFLKQQGIDPKIAELAPAVTETHSLSFTEEEMESIDIKSPEESFEALESIDNQIHISFSVSARDLALIQKFKSQITQERSDKSISIRFNPSFYVCRISQDTVNGKTERWVGGTCVHDVRIAIPRGSKARVLYNGMEARGVAAMDIRDLPNALKSADNKLAMLQKFLLAHPEPAPLEAVANVLDAYSRDYERIKALQLFGSFADPQNASLVTSEMSFTSGKVQAVETIAAKTSQTRFIQMSEVATILRSMTGDSDRLKLCEILRGRVIDPENVDEALRQFMSSFSREKAARDLVE
jgi:hypothetical protein